MAGSSGLGLDPRLRPPQARNDASSTAERSRLNKPVEVTVVPYREELKTAFGQLNREWIETYFAMEDADRKVLGDPRGEIVDRGGEVFFLLEGDQVRGTCAVLRHSPADYEIAKMAVAPEARGRGYGDLLMEAAIRFAGDAGARRVIIVSNTLLEPAIRLYQKHGFVQVPLTRDQRYLRANIRLELELPRILDTRR
jgi:putative acetyltransferase